MVCSSSTKAPKYIIYIYKAYPHREYAKNYKIRISE